MDNYIANSNGLADELDELLDEFDAREAGVALFKRLGDDLFEMSDEEEDEALKFLGRTAGQRSKVLRKLDAEAAASIILRARYFAIVGHRQMLIAQRIYENVVGSGYRAATEYAARTAINTSVYPDASKVVRSFNPYARPRSR
jgi:thermostable 8-oxoguanine DNA glycosylase